MSSNLPTGFLEEPRPTPDGSTYFGRFQLYDVQWTSDANGLLVTSTVSAQMVLDAATADILWTDQTVQRGIRPEAAKDASRLLSLKDGFPDRNKYVFDQPRSEEIAEKLLRGDRLFLNPLIWNARPGEFSAYLDEANRRLYLYDGRIYLPDSHHRHQALVHAMRTYASAPHEYPEFSPERQFTVELYFMTREDEGEYFYEKNNLGKTADKSKALDVTTQDNLALTARRAIDLSPSLTGNVNRVTDRLSARNRQVMTLSTLVGILRTVAGTEIPAALSESLAQSFATFYELLCEVRPELGLLSEADRLVVRQSSMVDQAVVLHGLAPLIKSFHEELQTSDDLVATTELWRHRLSGLGSQRTYRHESESGLVWEGDLFDRANPIWREEGILQPTKSGTLTVSNTRQTRGNAGKVLQAELAPDEDA